jgi:hypothetical protein
VLEDRTVPTAVAAPSGLVSWWTANNTAADVSGLNNASLTGVTYASGEVGQAFSFDGTDDRAQLTDSPSLQFTTSMSIEGWIKVNGFPTGTNGDDHGEILFRGDDRGGLDPYSLSVEPNGTLYFQVTNANNSSASLAAPIAAGQFIHVAGTLDDATGTMCLYENGAIVAQEVTTIRPFQNLDPTQNPSIAIGNHGGYPNSPHNFPFNGLVDELSVYNRALTPGEVFGIYKAGSSGKVLSPIAIDSPSVVDGSGGATTPVTFTITRTGSLNGSLTVNWTTADDTAVAGTDYVAASGTVTFADGQATQTVQVTTIDNNNLDPNLDFKLIVTPVGGTSVMGLATIVNDDAAISVGNDSATEGSTSIRPLGAFVPTGLGGLSAPYAMIVGPDGNFYVSSRDGSAVYRYDPAGNSLPAPGQSGATFVTPGSGGLSLARDIAFGPDGFLYVVSEGTSAVLRYDPTTGAFVNTFLASGAGGLSAPRGLAFRTDALGHVYVYVTSVGPDDTPAPGTDSVLRFDFATGAPAGVSGTPGDAVFIPTASGGLDNPSRIVFGPDGKAYVSSTATTAVYATSNSVLRYDPDTGAPAGVSGQPGDAVFVSPGSGSLDGPEAMVFRPDGYLYVVGWRSNSVNRYQASNGAFAGQVVAPGSGGLSNPIDLLFDASGNLLVTSKTTSQVLRFGAASQFAFTVSLASATAGTTTVNYATADGTALAGRDYIATSGTLTFPPGLTSETVVVQTLDDGAADPTRAFTINLSNPVGGAITSGQGIGTILDDTRFYVVGGGASHNTYQYAVSGGALGNNALGSGNTAPRGVATTAAGTTEWVVDANKTVYVYSTGGPLLGSWSAGGLSSSATLTGITTNGTDVWLVDSYADKVYKYAGAASRLSGSQNAASSFSLAAGKNGNANPQDLVTDGTSFWVVDGSKLKVFKYTLSGSSLGSWAIDPANAHPTGITINPSNVSDVWIVDSGTLKVYQYVGAAGRTSGSQNAAATFALAAGDANPQGIADPPTADLLLTPAPALSAAAQQVPFREILVPVSVSPTGVVTYEGYATSFGRVTATVSPDNTFIKLAANGDAALGYVTHVTATTGTVTFTGGTGRFQGISGTTSYVILGNPAGGPTAIVVTGTVSFSHPPRPGKDAARVVPFQVNGGGSAPNGLPLFPGGTAPHDATGTSTLLGKYTGSGTFTLDGFTSATTGTFHGSFVFVSPSGERLATRYGAVTPGQFTIVPTADGKVIVQFVAVFTPVPAESTGRFAKVTGGGFIMVATTEPFDPTPNAQGYTMPFHYTWQGFGDLEFGHGDE